MMMSIAKHIMRKLAVTKDLSHVREGSRERHQFFDEPKVYQMMCR